MRVQALEHIVSIQISLGRFDDVIVRYRELLALTADPQVTSNERSHAINAILNAVTDTHNSSVIEEVYRITLEQLRSLGNQERIYFNVSMKLCRSYLDSNQFERGRCSSFLPLRFGADCRLSVADACGPSPAVCAEGWHR